MDVIRADHLGKRFGSIQAVDDLTFRVSAGRVTGFLGPNGSGKTTTLRMLLGLVAPTSGSATIAGRPYRSLPEPAAVVGAVLEAGGLHPGRTARAHLRILTEAAGLGDARVRTALAAVGLEEAADRRIRGYSLGMRQRLAIAAALLADPPVLILDEPTNGLDPHGIRWLRGRIRSWAGEGRTVLYSSHSLAEIARTADELLVVARGRLVGAGPLEAFGDPHGTDGGTALEERYLALTGPAQEQR